MVRGSKALLRAATASLNSIISEFLVCPLSKQPLRYCPHTQSLISDAIGVSYPVVDGIPCLVPTEGKVVEDTETSKANIAGPSTLHEE